jgi:hypothetical protein
MVNANTLDCSKLTPIIDTILEEILENQKKILERLDKIESRLATRQDINQPIVGISPAWANPTRVPCDNESTGSNLPKRVVGIS